MHSLSFMPLYSSMRLWGCSWERCQQVCDGCGKCHGISSILAGFPFWMFCTCRLMHGQQTAQRAPSLLSPGCMSVLLLSSLSWSPFVGDVPSVMIHNRWLWFLNVPWACWNKLVCVHMFHVQEWPQETIWSQLWGFTVVYPYSATQTTAALHCEGPSVMNNGAARGTLAVLLFILHGKELMQGMVVKLILRWEQ